MTISSITGIDAINEMADASMHAVIHALISEDIITPAVGEEFLEEHVCALVEPGGGFKRWLRKAFGTDAKNSMVVFKACILKSE